MSDIIKLLPDSVANQIAAGEVIQRPASVVKELVENSVDAGADKIQIIIKDAGRTLIQVVDNGSGMSATDARLAFERHSTSKITVANDLFTLHTMGFRGEALASIAAVSQVDVSTMLHGETLGTHLVINGSKVEKQEPVATAPGTNFMVKNLFFNVPARRKFLKKDSVELSNILHEFERLALVNPDRELTIYHNDAVLHQLLKGTLKQRIGALFGKALEKQLIPVETATSIVKISGFVGLPENARKRGALQYFFVNGRNMRHPYFHKAVVHCYEQLIRPDEQPNYFINFEVDPSTIDVNIHPTKNEIKFENEQPIWQILAAAIRESLGRFNAMPSIDFNAVDVPDIPAFNPSAATAPISVDSNYNPFAPANGGVPTPMSGAESYTASRSSGASRGGASMGDWQREHRGAVDNWEKLYERFTSTAPGSTADMQPAPGGDIPSSINGMDASLDEDSLFGNDGREGRSSQVMQLKGRYILSQNRNGLVVVDQHRAHVRILYDKYINRRPDEKIASQKVLFPEIVCLTPAQNILLREIMDEVESAGFELEFVGQNKWAVNGVPSASLNEGSAALLKSIIDDVSAGNDITRDTIRGILALDIARSEAIRAGRTLSQTEMEHLLSSLFRLQTPAYTPDGQKVIAEIRLDEIDERF